MMVDDNDGQMIFGDLGGLKLPDICLTGEEKPRKNLTQETCSGWRSNLGLLRDKRACYHLSFIMNFIENKFLYSNKELHMFLDACGGENRNRIHTKFLSALRITGRSSKIVQ